MKKKVNLILVAVLLVISLVVGLSYARWAMTNTQTTINKLTSSCFSMELTNEKDSINLNTTYPITDNEGKKLTPYQFTITNTCDLFASYTINLEMLEGTTLSSQYIKTMINSEAIANLSTLESATPTIDGATESRVLFKGSLGAGDSTDYTFRLWMDYDAPLSSDTISKVFNSKITVTSEVSTYSPVENGFTNLAEALLVNEYQTTSVDVAKNKISSKQEVDTSKTAPIINWQEVYDSNTINVIFSKADPQYLGTFGIGETEIKITFGNSYTFDPEKGYYVLADKEVYDPTIVDFNEKNYYSCGAGVGTTTDNKLVSNDGAYCTTLYRVKKLNSVTEGSITLSGGDVLRTKKYEFEVYRMTEIELESDKSDKGLYQAQDDFGTTYYYRGNVTNNNIKFAGFYWKIVRINGDGSIRLIYNGTASTSTGDDTTIGKSAFNNSRIDPTYVGYMYSNTLNVSYEDTIKNDNDSAIKSKLDTWYKTNIFDAGFSKYISDSGFCNDRSLSSSSPGLGYENDKYIYFAAKTRMEKKTPTFICSNISNDLFTLAGNSKGNEKLTYPIGLITIDEISFAGSVYNSINRMTYLYSKVHYWTMTPYYYGTNGSPVIWLMTNDSGLTHFIGNNTMSIRPVINLKSTTEITGGIGTINDPFIVK